MDGGVILQALVSGLFLGGVYALVALALNINYGVMRILNFSHGSLMMLGMFTTYWAFTLWGIDPYLTLAISMPLLFLIGRAMMQFIISRTLQAPPLNQLLLTLGVALMIENSALVLWSPNYRTLKTIYTGQSLYLGATMISVPRLIAFSLSLLLCGLLFLLLAKTDLGKAMRACAEEKEGAVLVGIDLKKIYYTAFGIGAACVGAAGTAITPFFYVSPDAGSSFTLIAFVIVILGGMGSSVGALVGGLMAGLFESLGAVFMPGSLKQVPILVAFILVLMFKPTGLFGGK